MRTGGAEAHLRSVRSLYLHVPFCSHKCHYCDFYSLVDTQDRQEVFAERLIRELHGLSRFAAGGPLKTVFVGGGTPSLLRVDLWEALLAEIEGQFDLSAIRAGEGEFTVECNPESVSARLLETLRRGGVDRLSMGAQSFHLQHLKTLERLHNPETVGPAIAMARDAGFERLSVDLIFGIPGQSLDDWCRDLDSALGLGTEHLSCYNLTYEQGTAMTARLQRGDFAPADEDLEVDMYELTVAHLAAAGLRRYEVSNYSKPGQESLHNLAYWRQEEWLAAGPSASGHVAGWRWKNVPRLDDYLRAAPDGLPDVADSEPPDAARALRERMWTGLRLREGLDAARLLHDVRVMEASGVDRLRAAADKAHREGLLEDSGNRWTLTDRGMLIADAIVVDFMAALDG
ncbi:MAG: radical SAM family heme chaperone HemW [Phycisphaeraceae bacterium]|nr:radical SAM family heme chaperone HemW [Phycisphaeraceae bacterium]